MYIDDYFFNISIYFRIIANYISINFPIKIQEQISKKFFYQILNADYQYISKEKLVIYYLIL